MLAPSSEPTRIVLTKWPSSISIMLSKDLHLVYHVNILDAISSDYISYISYVGFGNHALIHLTTWWDTTKIKYLLEQIGPIYKSKRLDSDCFVEFFSIKDAELAFNKLRAFPPEIMSVVWPVFDHDSLCFFHGYPDSDGFQFWNGEYSHANFFNPDLLSSRMEDSIYSGRGEQNIPVDWASKKLQNAIYHEPLTFDSKNSLLNSKGFSISSKGRWPNDKSADSFRTFDSYRDSNNNRNAFGTNIKHDTHNQDTEYFNKNVKKRFLYTVQEEVCYRKPIANAQLGRADPYTDLHPSVDAKFRRPSLASSHTSSGSATVLSDAIGDYELDQLLCGNECRTTLMIRHIPNKYTKEMLVDFINETHKGKYDFLYLRIDFKNKCNLGYAFVNFTDGQAVALFAKRVMHKKWNHFKSDKICIVCFAAVQGIESLIQKFRNSSVMLEPKEYQPIIFHVSGELAGTEREFPSATCSVYKRNDVLFGRD